MHPGRPRPSTPAALVPFLAVSAAAVEPDFTAAAGVLQDAVEDRAFPGCSVAVGSGERVLWSQGFGRFVYDRELARSLGIDPDATPDNETLYDLASLTKVAGTTLVVATLLRDGLLALEDPVIRYVPEFAPPGLPACDRAARAGVTVEHLLVHASGLPAWAPIFRESGSREAVVAAVLATPLEAAPGSRFRYSDLGFILLGEVAARAGGEPLEALERERVFGPLGLARTLRNPPPALWREIPPAEVDAASGRPIHGVVHDENARAGGGRTGHAGLFSCARDLSKLAGEMLRALRGESRLLPREIALELVTRRGLVPGSSRALGWDTPSAGSSAGESISPRAFGHTGFTGTSIWIDPDRDVYIVLLANRVHPTRANQKIGRVRRQLADAVIQAFDEARRRRRI